MTATIHYDHKQSKGVRPVHMEDYFSPGYKTKPAVHIGSQSMRLYASDELEQAIEGLHMAAASEGDIVVVRNIDPLYIKYWQNLMGNVEVINIQTDNKTDYLSTYLLSNSSILEEIKNKMHPDAKLMVYFPTELENKVADKLGIKLHGTPHISNKYGTKTGIRELANEAGIPMAAGYSCVTKTAVVSAIKILFASFDSIIIKHTLSSAGRWMKRLYKDDTYNIDQILDELSGGKFVEGKDSFVVEGWVTNKASLCAHIEILENKDPIISAGWQQIIAPDGITYMGAGPLMLSPKAMRSYMKQVTDLAFALKAKGAVGSFGPDFMITDDKQTQYEPDTSLLLELNARTPVTPFALEIIKQVKGEIGSGFLTQNIKLTKNMTFTELQTILKKEGLLVEEKDKNATGIVPYNIGLLNWNYLYYVVMAQNWDETTKIANKVKAIFGSE